MSRAALVLTRWRGVFFLLLWTGGVLCTVWWLVGTKSSQPELLVSLDNGEMKAWSVQARHWVGEHVELYRAYPWLLFSTYVLWFGAWVPLERHGWPWRVALHLVAAAAFIAASQWLTNRLAASQPKVIFIRSEEVLSQVMPGATNVSEVVITRELRVGTDSTSATNSRPHPFISAGVSNRVTAASNATMRAGTNLSKVWVRHTERSKSVTNLSTNGDFAGPATNELARLFASELSPMIEERIRAVRDQQTVAFSKWSAVLDGTAYLALVGLAQAAHLRRKLREREQHAVLLESQLNQSRLSALHAQLQPHFLFNTLNGIAALTRRDPRAAEEMLMALSDLLRWSLGRSGQLEIPLREELEFLGRYLELQQMRFGERLRIEKAIEPGTLDCLVPALILQPLVENAVRHGIEPSPAPGLIRIAAQREGGQLNMSVEDNGVGLGVSVEGTARCGNGIGLTNARERLAALYGRDHEFSFHEKRAGGVIVTVRIPLRPVFADAGPHAAR
ncbi:MAG: histidine kinase [Verrucomicrobiales bacterium]|nr:histidine kinase [Verrucomicrobiales bacterium]